MIGSPFEDVKYIHLPVNYADFSPGVGIGIKVIYNGKMYRNAILCKMPCPNIKEIKKKLHDNMLGYIKVLNSTNRCEYTWFQGRRHFKTIHEDLVEA